MREEGVTREADSRTVVNGRFQAWRENEDSMVMGYCLDWKVSGVVENGLSKRKRIRMCRLVVQGFGLSKSCGEIFSIRLRPCMFCELPSVGLGAMRRWSYKLPFTRLAGCSPSRNLNSLNLYLAIHTSSIVILDHIHTFSDLKRYNRCMEYR
jgi:hypothetical protein